MDRLRRNGDLTGDLLRDLERLRDRFFMERDLDLDLGVYDLESERVLERDLEFEA